MLEGRRNLLVSWHDVYQDEPMLLSDVLRAVDATPDDTGSEKDQNLRLLGESIHDMLPNGKPTSRALSKVLRRFVGRTIDGQRLVYVDHDRGSKKAKRWKVECAA